ncbi:HTH-type transcriptional regulator DmlR [Pseudoalteromonas holothuriae]|uniref:HTH-type transcriptional regulator DmlR n=1 Tax=Pseudoalteromonas holothuriae TaxID=2963714 RepID=A0A9W4VVB3_9GAMM|nr:MULTISPECIES: LysR family transcriptional regulator [unclassified Pseudoalteromonas]CAH9065410.1 HTH-type transcriptional regulator DmlR [Pseudoalteromonas sp. CIP111854]CAH9067090.1 HTH-type transcriptional regulator DmlR [Pseudoalteromonas sp. CIP111951]
MMIWQGLEVFLAVVEQGSFSKAAEKLEVSTSYVSRQVLQLEQRLGTVLIQRTTRTQNLTDAGRQYAAKLKVIQQELIDATNQAQGVQNTPKGLIKIAAAGDFVANQVAPRIADFLKLYPEVTVDLDFNNRNVDLVEEGFDLAIRFGQLQDSNLVARKLCTRPMTWVVSKDYQSQHGDIHHPYELHQHNCLSATHGRWRFVICQQQEEVKVSGNWRSNNSFALINACLAGLGVAHLAKDIVQPYVEQGQLTYILEPFQVNDGATWLVYPRKDLMPYRVRLLIEFLLNGFAKK